MKLSHISSSKNGYLLLDLEKVYRLGEFFNLDPSDSAGKVILETIYNLLTKIIVPEVTGIILSSDFGWDILHSKPAKTGILLGLEQQSLEQDPLAFPNLNKLWTIESIRNNYGVAKLQLHYHPKEKNAAQKRKLVSELYEYAQYEKIDFVLELITKSHTDHVKNELDFQNAQFQAIQHFRQLCDMVILELPLDALTAATITAELDIPWLVSSQAKMHVDYKEGLRMCLENGAKGGLVQLCLLDSFDTVIINDESGFEELEQYLNTIARDYIVELRRIIDESQAIS